MHEVSGEDAGAVRNCRQVGDARRGAGPSPAAARIRRMVPSPLGIPPEQPGTLILIHADRIEHTYGNGKSVSIFPDQAMEIGRQVLS